MKEKEANRCISNIFLFSKSDKRQTNRGRAHFDLEFKMAYSSSWQGRQVPVIVHP